MIPVSWLFTNRIRRLERRLSRQLGSTIRDNEFSPDEAVNGRIVFGKKAAVLRSRILGQVEIGPHSHVTNAHLTAYGDTKITMGRYSIIQGGESVISAKDHDLDIGSFCNIGHGAHIVSYSHRMDTYTTAFIEKRHGRPPTNYLSLGPVRIGHDCTIGIYSVVFSNVTLGNGCMVMPNSVVTASFPPYSIIAGVPATKIGVRFSQRKIDYLEKLNWYDWDDKKILRNMDLLVRSVSTKRSFS